MSTLDPSKHYLAVRVGRTNRQAVWVICPESVDIQQVDGTVLFVAFVTHESAVQMIDSGAEVFDGDTR